jgi:hypothetical protein
LTFDIIDIPGGNAGGATPVPISNTVVKPSRADGTALVTVWESRSLPGVNSKRRGGFFTSPLSFRMGLFSKGSDPFEME